MSVVTDSQACLTHCRHSALSGARTLPAAVYDFSPDTIHSLYFALLHLLKGLVPRDVRGLKMASQATRDDADVAICVIVYVALDAIHNVAFVSTPHQ